MRTPALVVVVALGPATAAAAPSSWISPASAPWRLPVSGATDVVIVDAKRALVTTRTELLVVDRTTGTVAPPVRVIADDDSLDRVRHVGTRLLGFGRRGDVPAIWELSLSPPSARLLATDDPGGGNPELLGGMVRPSPDGSKLAICSRTRWPVIRDARTLRVLRLAKDQPCYHVRWLDNTRVAIGRTAAPKVLDVATGKVTELDRDAELPEFQEVRTSPGGAFVVGSSGDELTIRGPGRAERVVELPLGTQRFDVDRTTALALAAHGLVTVELATGAVTLPDDNTSMLRQVVPHGGEVLALADRLRVWRAGKVVATEPGIVGLGHGAPHAILTVDSFGWWDAATGRRQIAQRGFFDEVARAGDTVVLTRTRELWRGTRTSAPVRWFAAARGELAALDVASGIVALRSPEGTHVLDVDRRAAWTLQVPESSGTGCEAGDSIRITPGGARFAIANGSVLHVFERATRRPLAVLDLDDLVRTAWTMLASGEVLVAGPGELALWDPAGHTLARWATPTANALPQLLGASADGHELAVGYDDGRVLWVDLRGLRAEATKLPGKPAAGRRCPAPAQARFETFAR